MKKLLVMFLLLCVGSVMYAQRGTINVVVTDENDDPIVGANVEIKIQGKSGWELVVGTVTDLDGRATLTVDSTENFILVVSYPGYEVVVYEETKIYIGSTMSTSIKMKPDIESIDSNSFILNS